MEIDTISSLRNLGYTGFLILSLNSYIFSLPSGTRDRLMMLLNSNACLIGTITDTLLKWANSLTSYQSNLTRFANLKIWSMQLRNLKKEKCFSWSWQGFYVNFVRLLLCSLKKLGSLFKYADCPYSALLDGPPLARLSSRDNRLKLLNFLISECQAAMMNNLENQLEKCSLQAVSVDSTFNSQYHKLV